MELVALFVQLFESFLTVFGVCELGERLCMAFNEINIAIEQLKWYLFPHQIRKMLPTILVVSQEPVGLSIFGSMLCNRKTFKEVSSTNPMHFDRFAVCISHNCFTDFSGLQSNLHFVYDTTTSWQVKFTTWTNKSYVRLRKQWKYELYVKDNFPEIINAAVQLRLWIFQHFRIWRNRH